MGVLSKLYFASPSAMHRKQMTLVNELSMIVDKLEANYIVSNIDTPTENKKKTINLLGEVSALTRKARSLLSKNNKAVVERKIWKSLRKLHKQYAVELGKKEVRLIQKPRRTAADDSYFSFDQEAETSSDIAK